MKFVAIKGMEMPKGCNVCRLHQGDYCDITRTDFYKVILKLPDCPLIEVEAPAWRTDMEDVPKDGSQFNVIDEFGDYQVVFWWKVNKQFGTPSGDVVKFIAWMPIPEFKP